MPLDDSLLKEFAHAFYGYGTYGARIWFVGMEEGGGDSVDGIQRRLVDWAKRGRSELQDLPKTAAAMGDKTWFGERPKLQRTWNMLIRIAMASEGKVPSTEEVREYQKNSLGRHDGDNCLLELLPLPSPSLRHWIYGTCSQLKYLETRERYRNKVIPERIPHLRQRVSDYKPQVVVFYGLAYRPHWEEIAGVSFEIQGDARYGRNHHTVFVIAKHPAAKGVSKEYFHELGKNIGERIRCGGVRAPLIEQEGNSQ